MIYVPECWKVKKSGIFNIFELNLNNDEFAITNVDVPVQNQIAGTNIGINTYRANAIVKGAFEFTTTELPSFTRTRGQDITDNRAAIISGSTIRATMDNSQFWCIQANDFNDVLRLNDNYVIAPGETVTIPGEDKHQDIFIVEGDSVQINGTSLFGAFKHLTLTQVGTDYTITNTGTTDAFVIYFFEATVAEIRARCVNIDPSRLDLVPVLAPTV